MIPRRVALLGAAMLALAAALVGCGNNPAPSVNARGLVPADAFVDSLGVGVHLTYYDTAYGNLPQVMARLQELGVRHVRDNLLPSSPPTQVAAIRTLAGQGIRSTLIAGNPKTGNIPGVLGVARQVAPSLAALEGPNEWELFGGGDWVGPLKRYQMDLYRAMKADAVLKHVPVVAPSLASAGAWQALGDIHSSVDIGNGHPYTGGRSPEYKLEERIADFRVNSGNRPIWATEAGYQTSTTARNGQPGVDERIEAGLILRTYLEYFKRGIPRTFVYELVDEKPDPKGADAEWHFGLLRYDFSPKPAFNALRNLVTLLRDPGKPFRPQPVAFKLHGNLEGVQALTLAKRDGTVSVVLWRRVNVWDQDARRPVAVAPRPITLDLAQPIGRARVFAPTESITPKSTVSDARSVPVTLGPDPVVVELSPRAG